MKAMRRFILLLLAMALLIVVGDQVIGRIVERVYHNTSLGEVGRLNRIADSVHTDILVMGASRALHHYVPTIITDTTGLTCYNCGLEGESVLTHYALLRNVTQRYMPRLILYDVAYYFDIEGGTHTRRAGKIKRMSSLQCRDSILADIDRWERLRTLSRIYPYNSVLFESLLARHGSGYDVPDADNGYVPLHGRFDDSHFVWNNEIINGGTDPVKLRYLESLISRYHDRLIVFSSPRYGATEATDTLYDPARQLCQRYGVPFVMARCDTAFTHHLELWDDDGHLNDDGARLYTRKYVIPAVKQFVER